MLAGAKIGKNRFILLALKLSARSNLILQQPSILTFKHKNSMEIKKIGSIVQLSREGCLGNRQSINFTRWKGQKKSLWWIKLPGRNCSGRKQAELPGICLVLPQERQVSTFIIRVNSRRRRLSIKNTNWTNKRIKKQILFLHRIKLIDQLRRGRLRGFNRFSRFLIRIVMEIFLHKKLISHKSNLIYQLL